MLENIRTRHAQIISVYRAFAPYLIIGGLLTILAVLLTVGMVEGSCAAAMEMQAATQPIPDPTTMPLVPVSLSRIFAVAVLAVLVFLVLWGWIKIENRMGEKDVGNKTLIHRKRDKGESK